MTDKHSFLDVVEGVAYASRIRCASIKQLIGFVRERLNERSHDTSRQAVYAVCNDLRERGQGGIGDMQERSACSLVSEDLERILKLVESVPSSHLDHGRLSAAFEEITTGFEALGLTASHARFEIVDSFPGPYRNLRFGAMSFDATDRELHGIEPGVRLLAHSVLPVYAEATMAHELTHAVLGRKPSDRLARGLEEGFADFLGRLMVLPRLVPIEWCLNIVRNTRLSFPRSSKQLNYTEAVRQVLLVYLTLGMPAILEVAYRTSCDGRQLLKQFEEQLLAGQPWPDLVPRQAAFDAATAYPYHDELRSFSTEFLCYPRSLVVSPLAFNLAHSLTPGTAALDNRLGLDQREQVNAAVQELAGERVYVVVVNKQGVVSFNESGVYLNTGCLRYSLSGLGNQ